MLKSSIDAYGSVNKSAALQNTASSQTALKSASTDRPAIKVENKQKVDTSQPAVIAKADLEVAVKKLNALVAPSLQAVEFSIDQESDRLVVKVVDTVTNAVLRQIPNDEVLAMSKTLDKLQGLSAKQVA